MKKQTAIDYLSSKVMAFNISSKEIRDFLCWLEEAKEMEKEQIMESFLDGYRSHPYLAEQYYNETYGKDA
jgi:hypothetical protein